MGVVVFIKCMYNVYNAYIIKHATLAYLDSLYMQGMSLMLIPCKATSQHDTWHGHVSMHHKYYGGVMHSRVLQIVSITLYNGLAT